MLYKAIGWKPSSGLTSLNLSSVHAPRLVQGCELESKIVKKMGIQIRSQKLE